VNGKIYLAGPWFNPTQVERYEEILGLLTEWRDEYLADRGLYVPRENPCPPNASDATRQRIYDRNLTEIEDASAVVAITDEKDVGTIYELGYAACLRDLKPRQSPRSPLLVGVALTLGDRPFNLMLARGLDATCTSIAQLRAVLFHDASIRYLGEIE
jgi:hypothetical protein